MSKKPRSVISVIEIEEYGLQQKIDFVVNSKKDSEKRFKEAAKLFAKIAKKNGFIKIEIEDVLNGNEPCLSREDYSLHIAFSSSVK